MHDLPHDLLDRPAPEGARWIALARLRRLIAERRRLDDPGDAEALHDFRVALRRLRTVVRIYRDVLGDSAQRQIRRRLFVIAQAAGVSRDAEVRLLWISERRDRIEGADRRSLLWVEQQLRRGRRMGDQALRRELTRDFGELTGRLQRRLRRYRVTLAPGNSRPLPATRELISHKLHELTDELRVRLDAPKRVGAVRALHLARIAAKRLRYALEPLAEGRVAPARVARMARAAIAQLGSLQDGLGEIHDSHLFRRWLRQRTLETSVSPAIQYWNLRGLQRLLAEKATASFGLIFEPASRRRIDRLLGSVDTAANALR